jgi:4-amino-4-deoxy-L-arabinose transferase-like glycosyltransferase
MERTGRYRSTAAALLAGAALRGAFLCAHPAPSGDALAYGDLAGNMLAHHVFGYTEDVLLPTLVRLPGYPAFLALCFSLFGSANYLAVICVQAALDLLSCWLLGTLARRLMGSRAGMATLWLAALCPFTANYCAVALTESLSVFCVIAALFSLERWIATSRAAWAWLLGLALSFAVLMRPDQLLLAAAAIPAMLWVALRRRDQPPPRRWLPSGIVILVVALPLLLWGVRNWRVFHVIQPLAPRYANDPGEPVPFGFQRWYRSWAVEFISNVDVYWPYDGREIALDKLPSRAFDTPAQRAETAAVFAQYNQEDDPSPAIDDALGRIAAQRIAAHPLRYYVILPLARETDMWLRPRTELMRNLPLDWWRVRRHPTASALEIAYAALNAAFLLLALAGLLHWKKLRWSPHPPLAAAALGFVALRCVLLLTLDNSEPRYTLECFPVILLLAGFAFAGRSLTDSQPSYSYPA